MRPTLVVLPGGLLMVCTFSFTGKMAGKISPYYLIIFGLLLFFLSIYLTADADYLTLMRAFMI